jgi:hypothetical protein
MSLETVTMFVGGGVAGLLGLLTIALKIPKRLKANYFVAHWRELQSYCKDKKSWPKAIGEADKLLDRALKKRKFKGKSMGERMVAAQRTFSDNDGAWFAHNLAKKIVADSSLKLKESDVKDALVAFRQALRDVGALPGEANEVKVKR